MIHRNGCGTERQMFDATPPGWGAYVVTEDELLASGRVAYVGEDIVATRTEARERSGWIMDTYLLRRCEKR